MRVREKSDLRRTGRGWPGAYEPVSICRQHCLGFPLPPFCMSLLPVCAGVHVSRTWVHARVLLKRLAHDIGSVLRCRGERVRPSAEHSAYGTARGV